jgi:hypothetical protein
MPGLKKPGKIYFPGIVILLGIFLCSLISCKTSDEVFDVNILVYNESGTTIDVYLDAVLKGAIDTGNFGTLFGVTRGTHTLEAKGYRSDILFTSLTFDIVENKDYEWLVEGPSSITVTNKYGETLQIFADGILMGDLTDTLSETITKVTIGEHTLTAAKKSDSTKVAETTIIVNEVKEYSWVITK